ncbi:hypothetical protein ACFLS9_09540 [Bacteroidota bacterium]
MNRCFQYIFISWLVIFYINLSGQEGFNIPAGDDQLRTAKTDLFYNRVVAVENTGNIAIGLLIGLKADTLVLVQNNIRLNLPLKEMVSISIENEGNYTKGLVVGSIIGMYLGNIIFFHIDREPTAYIANFDVLSVVLANLLSVFVGGSAGYFIDMGMEEEEVVFNFDVKGAEWSEEYKRLRRFLFDEASKKDFHLFLQASKVFTRLSELEDKTQSGYAEFYNGLSNFNMLRRIQLTYSFTNNMEAGTAICWLGEPFYRWYYDHNGNSYSGFEEYEGVGYYGVISYKPLADILPSNLDWRINAALGLADINYKYMNEIYEYEETNGISKTIDKNLLSAYISTQFDILLYDGFSMGLLVDYIYVDEKMPEIPEFGLDSRELGNFSIGISIGIHF